MAGFDPAIHRMDPRLESGGDERGVDGAIYRRDPPLGPATRRMPYWDASPEGEDRGRFEAPFS
jgi:hypothetical protein